MIRIAINLGNLFRIIRLADTAIELLYRNGGAFPSPDAVVPNVAGGSRSRRETPFENHVTASLPHKREVIEVDIEAFAALDPGSCGGAGGRYQVKEEESGFVGYYRYRVYEEADKIRLWC